MKNISRMLVVVLLVAVNGFSFADQPDLVSIRTVDGERVWVTKRVLRETYNEVFGNPSPVLSPAEKAKMKLKVRKESYDWAFSSSGMNLSQSEATRFSEEMISRENPAEAFSAFKTAYTFAFSSSGVNLSQSEARKTADSLSRLETPNEMVEVFKEAYTHAFSSSGMNLSQSQALKHALRAVGIER